MNDATDRVFVQVVRQEAKDGVALSAERILIMFMPFSYSQAANVQLFPSRGNAIESSSLEDLCCHRLCLYKKEVWLILQTTACSSPLVLVGSEEIAIIY